MESDFDKVMSTLGSAEHMLLWKDKVVNTLPCQPLDYNNMQDRARLTELAALPVNAQVFNTRAEIDNVLNGLAYKTQRFAEAGGRVAACQFEVHRDRGQLYYFNQQGELLAMVFRTSFLAQDKAGNYITPTTRDKVTVFLVAWKFNADPACRRFMPSELVYRTGYIDNQRVIHLNGNRTSSLERAQGVYTLDVSEFDRKTLHMNLALSPTSRNQEPATSTQPAILERNIPCLQK